MVYDCSKDLVKYKYIGLSVMDYILDFNYHLLYLVLKSGTRTTIIRVYDYLTENSITQLFFYASYNSLSLALTPKAKKLIIFYYYRDQISIYDFDMERYLPYNFSIPAFRITGLVGNDGNVYLAFQQYSTLRNSLYSVSYKFLKGSIFYEENDKVEAWIIVVPIIGVLALIAIFFMIRSYSKRKKTYSTKAVNSRISQTEKDLEKLQSNTVIQNEDYHKKETKNQNFAFSFDIKSNNIINRNEMKSILAPII